MSRTFFVALVVFFAGLAAPAAAQTPTPSPSSGLRVGGALGLASFWDDETFLGRGPMVAGIVGKTIGRHLLTEVELGVASHHRDSGYLIADGTPIIGTGRVAFLFPGPSARARGFVSAGLSVVRSTGTFTMKSTSAAPFGTSTAISETTRDWSLTKAGWEFGTGAEFSAGKNWIVRPELRMFVTAPESGYSPSTSALEPPILSMRGGVSLQRRW